MMKKISIILTLVALTVGVMAQKSDQDSYLENAMMSFGKQNFKKAKSDIDFASSRGNAKTDPKTWLYRGIIYSGFGVDINKNPKSKAKSIAPDWAEQAYTAAMECHRLDVNHVYVKENNNTCIVVGAEFYNRALDDFNSMYIQSALDYANKSIDMYNICDPKLIIEPTYIAGRCYKLLNDLGNQRRCYNNLVEAKTDKADVYRTLFNYHKEKNEKDAALTLALKFKENCPNDYNADLLVAEGYLLNQNADKVKELVESGLQKSRKDAAQHPQALCQAASLLEQVQEYDAAVAKYIEAIQLAPESLTPNHGMGFMQYNRAVAKYNTANKETDGDLRSQMYGEGDDLFRQAVKYLKAAVAIIDAMPAEAQPQYRAPLFNCLNALRTSYNCLKMNDELNAVNARMAGF